MPEQLEPASAQPATGKQAPPPSRHNRRLFAIIACLVALAILATVFVVVVLPRLKSADPVSDPSASTPSSQDTPESPEPSTGPSFGPRANIYGGNDKDDFNDVVLASNGDIIAVGRTQSTAGDFTETRGWVDAVIARFTSDGTLIWAHTYGGNSLDGFNAVALLPDGGIIAVGYTSSPDGDFPASHGYQDAVIARFDGSGALLWVNTYGGRGAENQFSAVTLTADGDIVAVGRTTSTDGDFPSVGGNRDAVVARVSSSGDLLWGHAYGGNDWDAFVGVTLATNGDIIAVGNTDSTDGDFPAPLGGQCALVARIAPEGDLLWSHAYGGSGSAGFADVALASNDDIIAVGSTSSTDGDFPARYDSPDALIARISPDGTLQWGHAYGGNRHDSFADVVLASNGDFFVVGNTDSTDGDFPSRDGSPDAIAGRMAPDGKLLWANAYGSNHSGANDWDDFAGVALATNGDIVAVGLTASEEGDYDLVIARLSPDGD
jgi:uncharacterized delta-60 repeat protein